MFLLLAGVGAWLWQAKGRSREELARFLVTRLLPRLEGLRDRLSRALVTFGRVPLFFYLVHVPVIHAVAAIYWKARFGVVGAWAQGTRAWPEAYEPEIRLTWGVWVLLQAGRPRSADLQLPVDRLGSPACRDRAPAWPFWHRGPVPPSTNP